MTIGRTGWLFAHPVDPIRQLEVVVVHASSLASL
jgi:hypothetical protein